MQFWIKMSPLSQQNDYNHNSHICLRKDRRLRTEVHIEDEKMTCLSFPSYWLKSETALSFHSLGQSGCEIPKFKFAESS